ncbi:unnamed protein product [Hydatigera taeniaeformis]|uniref:DnaJ homolog subfamily C member 1 n=1 Tax=Hydatigena taeniaeformis TaxID=6205 RepID=A0A0R3X2K7_HYDTA|nr:unnamed protein product [Hydatigera taeniaeformis]
MAVALILCCLSLHVLNVHAWDQSELEMFDLMEEMSTNFYEFLNVPPTATSLEIKRAYRKLSLEMHPDKNPNDANAGVKFRQLSVVYQILKDEERRRHYDEALENGIPDWRTPVFYYRKLRKMSNVEVSVLFSAVAITIHFATLWGLAFERRWTLREQLETHMKRHKASDKKKVAIDSEIAEQLKVVKWPTIVDLLPIALLRAALSFILGIPNLLGSLKGILVASFEKARREREEQRELKREQDERIQRRERQKKRQAEQSKMRHRQTEEADFDGFDASMYQMANLVVEGAEVRKDTSSGVEVEDGVSKPWLQTEEIALIRLANKYPGGYPDRWSKIAQILGRTVSDVTAKASEIAAVPDGFNTEEISENESGNEEGNEEDDYYLSKRKAKRIGKTVSQEPEKEELPVPDVEMEEDSDAYVSRKKQKALSRSKPPVMVVSQEANGHWTQKEQNQLETAMNSFPKDTPHRWQLIAECVPSRTLVGCDLAAHLVVCTTYKLISSTAEVIDRVKFLAENTKKKCKTVT